ncbi:exopolysaccharide biosynthesis polyprenyl glycosylphosphotransferase [Castellaniella sp. S9]|uniref:exopolysaccharide biosynthesis polyprenyl glycosylphosphotransferase n=1 Tax=Castellaniella sp. S9 TaxID=2993652 RepID=UPI0022B3F509|nr:exopolysaccharide biosynthesis polyprenyl glycosylphosphotransferase [Castellaniella sp. S9]
MVDRETFAAWVLACGLLLAALGSLRDVVTPLGYWVLWAAWALAAIGVTQRSAAPVAERPLLPASVRASYAALILGMLLSAWANHSAVTLYQAVKIGVIGLCCWVAWRLAAAVGWRLRILALQGVVAIVVLVFLASKAGPAGYYLDLGSAGREGSFLAWPGVIWKAGAFFMPLCLAATVTHPGRWIANGLAVAGCVFLVVVDGSRTGLLVVGLTVLAFGVLLVWRREWRLLSAARRALILCVPALFGLLVLSTAIGYLSHGSAAGLAGASSTAGGTAEALVEAAVDPVASTRLGQGDPQRVRLLRNGIAQSVDCLPLGCGFGSTAMDPGYGIAMHVHNAFLGALADFGVLGLAGMLGFIVAAALPLRGVLRDTGHRDAGEVYAIAASAGAALAYMGSLMLHTFSTEMSEWGYLILALAFAWLPSARIGRTAGAGAHEHPETLGCYERRHSRWYEVVLLGWPFQLVAGLLMIAVLPAMLGWGATFWRHMDPVRINTLIAVGLSFVVIVLTLRRLARFSGGAIIAHIAPVVTAVFLVAFAALFFSRSPYSRPILLLAYALALAWCYAGYFIGRRYRRLKLAVVPLGEACAVVSQSNLEVRRLAVPDLEGVRYDAVVADLDSKDLGPEWERFLAQCILSHIPVFHVRQMMETLTGRVEIDHLSENDVGSLLPSPLYSVCKRVIDIAGVLVVAPIALPLMLVTAIAVRLDSPGPALFVQSRVGLGGQDFRIYKFRSMRTDAECDGAQLAATDDDRITRVGAFIRQTRLDELPQLWNVLKGDMSLIGPRPEQRAFVDRFDREIPFYIYRHVVRPGITGWAQVMQGYAGDTDETSIKIQHDFYYIKHFSLWLDILVVFKTVRIILTGWGAR